MTPILVFSILVFLAIVVAGVGVFVHGRGEGARAMEQRLRTIGHKPETISKLAVERDSRLSSIPFLDHVLRRFNVAQRLELLLYQAGMSIRVGGLLLGCAVFGAAGYLVGLTLFHRPAPAILFLLMAAPIPLFYVHYRKSQRMAAFTEEFPDSLDLLVSALRAGLSFSAAMQVVAEESPEPVRSEFAITVDEQSLGLDFRETLVNLTRRVDSLDLRFFVTAVVLQRETGGNLAEILENTATLIRDRFRILGDIKTFTAQGRMTGAILFCLPVAIGVFMFVLTPDYFKPMIEHPGGRAALWTAAGMQLTGAFVIRKIVDIKV